MSVRGGGGGVHPGSHQLVKVQKAALRSVNGLLSSSHTSPLLQEFRGFRGSGFVLALYTVLNNIYFNTAHYLLYNLPRHSDVHFYSTRNRTNLMVNPFHQSETRACFSNNGLKLWNSLPNTLKNFNFLHSKKYKSITYF